MAVLQVLTYPDERLSIKAKEVTVFDDALAQTVKDMFETMYHDHGVGLAATQVGKAQRIFVMDTSNDQDAPKCLINPIIVNAQGEIFSEEGCLSFPGVYAKVKRAQTITCQYLNEHGQPQQITATGLEAYCIQHELDHLDGITFVDRLSKLKRNLLLKKFDKLQKAS